ncbi:MAG TPA: prolyl oligopeptidase family serine peptidase [Gemmataceae bacterium]|nr:prolyl oligopeptidase family serine peptidase [Gemmataceae bacterium]
MITWKWVGLVLIGFFCLGIANARADDPKDRGFLDRVYKDSDGTEAKYVLFVPHDYKADKAFPLILFLHGAGETGTDGQKPVKVGLGPVIKKEEKTFGFIAVFPQSQKRTWQADSVDGKRAIKILDEVIKEYKVDTKPIYITGLSMGGYGTWSMALKYPDRWAAIVPICGGGDATQAAKIKHIPCWCFHGDMDKAVPVERSRKMIEALKDAGASPQYTEYPGVGHNSWDKAYGTPQLFEWLLMQKLP